MMKRNIQYKDEEDGHDGREGGVANDSCEMAVGEELCGSLRTASVIIFFRILAT